jgi:hypothetical protein
MKKKGIISGLVILVFTVSCQKENENRFIDNFEIEYSVRSTWVDYNYSAHIDNNGSLFVTEEYGLINYNRENTYNLTGQDLDLIKEKLANLTEIKLKTRYGFGINKPTDLPIKKLLYKTNHKADSTWIYYPNENELPNNLALFLSTIIEIISENDTLSN